MHMRHASRDGTGDWDPRSGWKAAWVVGTGRHVTRARSVLLHGDRHAPTLESFYVAGSIGQMEPNSITSQVRAASGRIIGPYVWAIASPFRLGVIKDRICNFFVSVRVARIHNASICQRERRKKCIPIHMKEALLLFLSIFTSLSSSQSLSSSLLLSISISIYLYIFYFYGQAKIHSLSTRR